MRFACIAATLLLWTAPAALAQDINTFSFTLVPAGDLFGQPGQMVGWGYSVTNFDYYDWLSIDAVSTTANFTTGTADSFNFVSLIVAPGDTQESDFVPFTSGLYEVTIDPATPPGAFDAGTFEVSATWYLAEPGGVDCPDFSCVDTEFPVQTSDQQPFSVTATPEPQTWAFTLIGLFLVGFGGRHRLLSKSCLSSSEWGGWRRPRPLWAGRKPR